MDRKVTEMSEVKVAVRIRPLVDSEKKRGCQSIVHKTQTQPQVVVRSDAQTTNSFTYNYVFKPEDSQEMIYENSIKKMVRNLFSGYNVTILAYGQTGSGKTHTMGTAFDGDPNKDMGLIPRAITEIFEMIAATPNDDVTVQCSFVEIYMEKVHDLLSESPRDIVDIREISKSKFVIPNLTETLVGTFEETKNCLIQGSKARKVAATAMNPQSSRSHGIFTITVQKAPKNDSASATTAKFNLVDLAGSENAKKSMTVGEQSKQGGKINQGLLALGNVVETLASKKLNSEYNKYRDSKLTMLLKDSFGGNSMTLIIACVSPADYNYTETINTLKYADRAKKIKNKPVVNEDPNMAEINRLKAEVQTLHVKLLSTMGSTECDNPPTKAQLQKENREMVGKLQIAEQTIDSLNGKIEKLKQQCVVLDKLSMVNMFPEDLKRYEKKVRVVTTTIFDLAAHMEERNDCIAECSKPTAHSQSCNGATASIADSDKKSKDVEEILSLQRKLEESNAVKKRLKEALLELQKNKENKQLTKGASHIHSMSWLNGEIELISSIIEITQSYDRLSDSRAKLTNLFAKAIQQTPPNRELIGQIEESIGLHNAQMIDFRGQMNANDIDTKIKMITDGYQSLPECRSLVKNLLKHIVESCTKFNLRFTHVCDEKQTLEDQLQECKQKLGESVKQEAMLVKMLESTQAQSNESQQQIAHLSQQNKTLRSHIKLNAVASTSKSNGDQKDGQSLLTSKEVQSNDSQQQIAVMPKKEKKNKALPRIHLDAVASTSKSNGDQKDGQSLLTSKKAQTNESQQQIAVMPEEEKQKKSVRPRIHLDDDASTSEYRKGSRSKSRKPTNLVVVPENSGTRSRSSSKSPLPFCECFDHTDGCRNGRCRCSKRGRSCNRLCGCYIETKKCNNKSGNALEKVNDENKNKKNNDNDDEKDEELPAKKGRRPLNDRPVNTFTNNGVVNIYNINL